jgi:hypothetical protein
MRMRKSFVLILVSGFVALLSAGSEPVFAASSTCAGATCPTGPVPLDFRVIIPGMVRLQIGAATGTTALQFDTPASDVGDPTKPVDATGGDQGIFPNRATVVVRANSGTGSVDVTAATSGGGSGIQCQSGGCDTVNDFIAWNQISVTANGCGTVAAPVLNNAGTGSTNFPAVGGTVDYTCGWDFAYLNTTIPPAGTYFGTVTYTATGQP